MSYAIVRITLDAPTTNITCKDVLSLAQAIVFKIFECAVHI